MDAFVALLREAAGVVGVEAVRLWPQIVAITFVQSLSLVVLDTGSATLFAVLMRRCWRRHRQLVDRDGDDWVPVIPASAAVVCGGLSLFCLWMVTLQLPGVLYPEAKTVLDLIARAK